MSTCEHERLILDADYTRKTIVAVGMWKIAPQNLSAEPQRYQSPTGEETFGRVALLPQTKWKLDRRADGYTLEVAIPWSDFGVTAPANNTHLRGDLGVLVGDPTGSQTVLRRYLFNPDTAIVNDVPTEVRIEADRWGTLSWE